MEISFVHFLSTCPQHFALHAAVARSRMC